MSRPALSQGCATLTGSSAVTTTMGTAAHGYARSAMTTSATTCASQMAACPACPAGLGSTANSVSSQAPTCLEGGPRNKHSGIFSAAACLPWRAGLCCPLTGPQSQLGMLRMGLDSALPLLSAPAHGAKAHKDPRIAFHPAWILLPCAIISL